MNPVQRFVATATNLILRLTGLQARDYPLGPGIEASRSRHGVDKTTFSPADYGNYVATSNAVYACATGRADLLSALPIVLYRLNSQNEKEEVMRGPLYELLKTVNPFWTPQRLLYAMTLDRGLWGESWTVLDRGMSGKGRPREMWRARPDLMRVHPDRVKYIRGYSYNPDKFADAIPFNTDEVVFMPMFNPLDEYVGLSPIAAARLAADYASAAMSSNRNIFVNGMQAAGVVQPQNEEKELTPEQADDLEALLDKRFKGVDKAHRVGIFTFPIEFQELGMTPAEAEFLGGLKWSLEDVCRAYKWPLDLVGGERTYENLSAAMKAAYTHAVIPEANAISSEWNEQLLPVFGEGVDLVELDTTGVEVLQEDRTEIVGIMVKLIEKGVPLNDVLAEFMPQLLPKGGFAWGDIWYHPINLVPEDGTDPREAIVSEDPQEEERAIAQVTVAPGSAEHKVINARFDQRTSGHIDIMKRDLQDLFKRQQESVLHKLNSDDGRAWVEAVGTANLSYYEDGSGVWIEYRNEEEAALEPFERTHWIKLFREELRPNLTEIVDDLGEQALLDIGLTIGFDVEQPEAIRIIENRLQKFSEQVNETTWQRLKEALIEGIAEGEGIPKLAQRVEDVMQDRIRSSAETIARTEVLGASNAGTIEAWRQSGVVQGKEWIATDDDRVRDSHWAMHGTVVPLDADFDVNGASGSGPGNTGSASEDINCRCSLKAHLELAAPRTIFEDTKTARWMVETLAGIEAGMS